MLEGIEEILHAILAYKIMSSSFCIVFIVLVTYWGKAFIVFANFVQCYYYNHVQKVYNTGSIYNVGVSWITLL